MTPFRVVEVSANPRVRDEPMGSKRKFWFVDDSNTPWLFKYARPGTGEHWSEKVAAEIARVLEVPCAHVDLATCEGEFGSASKTFLGLDAGALMHGNEILQETDATYPTTKLRGVSKHTVTSVLDALERVDPPPGITALSAAECFVGYLMLDALIANGDRHHENWAVVQRYSTAAVRHLAPSYDHASSLGREISDAQRIARLDGRDSRNTVAAYLRRARSAFFASAHDAKTMSPVDAFRVAAARHPVAAEFWLARLRDLRQDVMEDIVRAVPPGFITDAARRFALEVVRESRATLLGDVA